MTENDPAQLDPGSLWLRWDPHVHAPGTIFNDQFKGEWEAYLTQLERREPTIRALGITDYYCLDCYRDVREAKRQGRLPNCDLIFANVELRLDVATGAGSWVNIHLLVSPEREDHLEELERFLRRLKFDAHGDSFCCCPEDLMKLGRLAGGAIPDDRTALRAGAGQFKVSFNQLRGEYSKSEWAKSNIIVAVAGAQGDGTSGVRDASDRTLREEVESFAHVIFSSSTAQREFWLGRKGLPPRKVVERYGGLKACLHGSDGHSVAKSGSPDLERFSWIKGAPIFDSLRQACIDPAGRAFVGEMPPPGATPSEVIARVSTNGTAWLKTPSIPLNPGLVAIIGARGSGKTALAEMIAAGCEAHIGELAPQSFLRRAREHLDGASVTLAWQTEELDTCTLDMESSYESDSYPRARYLSQQFVDELCSSDGMTDALLSEVERVVFEAHPLSERDGAIDFSDLREIRSARYRSARSREEEGLATLSERISGEIEKTKLGDGYRTQVREKEAMIARLIEDRGKLVAKGSEARVARLEALTSAAETVRGHVRSYKNREQQLLLVQDEVDSFRNVEAPEDLRAARERHPGTGIADPDWDNFLLRYAGDVDAVLKKGVSEAQRATAAWKGAAPPAADPKTPLIPDDADLKRQPLAVLEAEIARLQGQISIDRDTTQRFTALSTRITTETETLARLKEKLADAEGAKDRLTSLLAEREASYVRVFEAVLSEQKLLTDLYAPVRERLTASSGTLQKLSFTVARHADVQNWALQGEALLDLRRQGPFRGRGALQELAVEDLKPAWETGSAEDVAGAMRRFRDAHQASLLLHAPVPRTEQTEYRIWSRRFAQWLYGTDHIAVRYSVDYDGIDIRKLSPGTRGIVLLLLYLALDDQDERPLIIDQPEENLDPKSIYDELVALFRTAKAKRQVIMVTHNANLVINTDADQIIVADAGPHPFGKLPPITYHAGGLENPEIRRAVCDILEGGEHAFRERARRLRVGLDRKI